MTFSTNIQHKAAQPCQGVRTPPPTKPRGEGPQQSLLHGLDRIFSPQAIGQGKSIQFVLNGERPTPIRLMIARPCPLHVLVDLRPVDGHVPYLYLSAARERFRQRMKAKDVARSNCRKGKELRAEKLILHARRKQADLPRCRCAVRRLRSARVPFPPCYPKRRRWTSKQRHGCAGIGMTPLGGSMLRTAFGEWPTAKSAESLSPKARSALLTTDMANRLTPRRPPPDSRRAAWRLAARRLSIPSSVLPFTQG